ncbi:MULTISPECIES: hypothetical protein [Nocardiopsis]|nr:MULTISPECIES: hypothetical protein [Nocardiopsis]
MLSRCLARLACRVTYIHCGVPMEFEHLPRAQYVCMVCGASR